MQELDTISADQLFTVTETEWSAFKALLDKHYAEIAALLRYNKTKDESIQRLSSEVNKYRDGFAFSALKPFFNALITFREDCRKSIRDAKQFTLDDEKVKKFTAYLISDFEEMLSNFGLERNDNKISINGKPLSGLTQPKTQPVQHLTDEQKSDDDSQSLPCADEIKNISELIEYLNKSEAAVRLALQDRAAADKTIQEYITLAARTDAEHYYALVAPVSRQIYMLYDKISAKAEITGNYSGEEVVQFYITFLENVIDETGNILTNAGVKIETLNGIFDTQKHKLVKTILTNDEKLDRVIADVYTDCYVYDEKIIYHSKADVYKYQTETPKNLV